MVSKYFYRFALISTIFVIVLLSLKIDNTQFQLPSVTNDEWDRKRISEEFCNRQNDFEIQVFEAPEVQPLASGKIFCLVLTTFNRHQTRAKFVADTWGKQCDGLMFVSDQTDPFLTGSKKFSNSSNYGSLWTKVRNSFQWSFDHFGQQFDWYLKSDDDTFVNIPKLRLVLQNFDSRSKWYFGKRFLGVVVGNDSNSVQDDRIISYADGGSGYILSKATLHSLVTEAFHNKEKCAQSEVSTAEDIQMGSCLASIGLSPFSFVEKSTRCDLFVIRPPWKNVSKWQMNKEEYMKHLSEPCPGAGQRWFCAEGANMLTIHQVIGNEMKKMFEKWGST